MEDDKKVFPDDYSLEERKIIKEIVIARLQAMPDSLRMSLG